MGRSDFKIQLKFCLILVSLKKTIWSKKKKKKAQNQFYFLIN